MRTLTMRISEDLHTRFKIACTLEGTDMSEVVRKFIEDYVERVGKRKLIPHGKKT
jgi:hypothetical protein